MELEQYKQAVKNHDWYYNFSDDHRVWSRGNARHTELLNIAKNGNNDFKRVYNEEWKKYFNPSQGFSSVTSDYVPVPYDEGEYSQG